jgi:hypothetical protein
VTIRRNVSIFQHLHVCGPCIRGSRKISSDFHFDYAYTYNPPASTIILKITDFTITDFIPVLFMDYYSSMVPYQWYISLDSGGISTATTKNVAVE